MSIVSMQIIPLLVKELSKDVFTLVCLIINYQEKLFLHILSIHISMLLKNCPKIFLIYMKNVTIIEPYLLIKIICCKCISNRTQQPNRE